MRAERIGDVSDASATSRKNKNVSRKAFFLG